MYSKQSLLQNSSLSNDIVLSFYSDRPLSNNTETKSESMSDILSDWSSVGIVLASVTTDYMRPKRSWDFSRTVSTFSANLQSPYWHFWHHLLEILNSTQLSSLHKTPAPIVRPATSAFLIKDTGVKTVLQQEGTLFCSVLEEQTVVGDNFVCKSHRVANAAQPKTLPLRSCWCSSLSADPCLSTSTIFQVKSYI